MTTANSATALRHQIHSRPGNQLTGVVSISAGAAFSVALKSDGTVWAWGFNGYGQLGDGTTTSRPSPVQVVGLTGVMTIVAGPAQ